jgi:hypothetical protein
MGTFLLLSEMLVPSRSEMLQMKTDAAMYEYT